MGSFVGQLGLRTVLIVLFVALWAHETHGDIACGGTIILDYVNKVETLVINGSISCPNCTTLVEISDAIPLGTWYESPYYLKATFKDLYIPEGNTMTMSELSWSSTPLVSVTQIDKPLEPMYGDRSMVFSLAYCGIENRDTRATVEFSIFEATRNQTFEISGGSIGLKSHIEATILTSHALSHTASGDVHLMWNMYRHYVFESLPKIELLEMRTENNSLCIQEVCIRNSVKPFTPVEWYVLQWDIDVNYSGTAPNLPDAVMKIRLTRAGLSSLKSQPVPVCDTFPNLRTAPTRVEDLQDITLTSPFYISGVPIGVQAECHYYFYCQSCRYVKVDILYMDCAGYMSMWKGEFTKKTQIFYIRNTTIENIDNASPAFSISDSTHIGFDLKHPYGGSTNDTYRYRVMFRLSAVDTVIDEVGLIQSFGISTNINNPSQTLSFVTPGYPKYSADSLETWWTLDKGLTLLHMKIEIIEFDVGNIFFQTDTSALGSPFDGVVYFLEEKLLIRFMHENTERRDDVRGLYFKVSLVKMTPACPDESCNDGETCFNCGCNEDLGLIVCERSNVNGTTTDSTRTAIITPTDTTTIATESTGAITIITSTDSTLTASIIPTDTTTIATEGTGAINITTIIAVALSVCAIVTVIAAILVCLKVRRRRHMPLLELLIEPYATSSPSDVPPRNHGGIGVRMQQVPKGTNADDEGGINHAFHNPLAERFPEGTGDEAAAFPADPDPNQDGYEDASSARDGGEINTRAELDEGRARHAFHNPMAVQPPQDTVDDPFSEYETIRHMTFVRDVEEELSD